MFAVRLSYLQVTCFLVCLATADRNIGVDVSSSEEDCTPIGLPSGYIRYSDIGTAYKISSHSTNWDTARLACISEGGRLAVIDTEKKAEYLRNQMSGVGFAWVGIHRERWLHPWRAVDDSQFAGPLPWGLTLQLVSNHCVAMGNTELLFGLGSYMCPMSKRFACEILDPEYSC